MSATVLAILISGAGWVIKAEWDRGKCAYLVFEKTHTGLSGGEAGGDPGSNGGLIPLSFHPPWETGSDSPVQQAPSPVQQSPIQQSPVQSPKGPVQVQVTDNGAAVSGTGLCGGALEKVALLKLENVAP